MIFLNISTTNNCENLAYSERNKVNEEINTIKINIRNAKCAVLTPIDNINNPHDKNDNKELTRCNDSQRVF